MFRIDDMAVFSAVVEAQSFTKAALVLEVSRAQVSKRINELEEALGVRLLNRTTRRLSLTESGQVFYSYCVNVNDTVAAARTSLKEITSKPAGTIKVAMPIAFGEQVFSPMIAELLESYPELSLKMDYTDEPVDPVKTGYDICIRWGGPLQPSSLIAKRLASLKITVCATQAFFEKYGVPKKPADLKQYNCLIYSPLRRGAEIWFFNDLKGRRLEIPVSGNIEANHADPLLEAARKGLGLLYAPAFLVREELATKKLIPVLEQYASTEIGIYALYPHRNLAPKTRAFLDFLTRKLDIWGQNKGTE